MKIIKISQHILPLVIALGFSSGAFAVASHSFYLGGQGGVANHGVETKEHGNTYIVSVDKNNLAGRVFAGYQFGPNIGTELGYAKYKNVPLKHMNGGDARQQSLDLVVKGSLPIANGFGLFAEGGLAYVDNKIDPSHARRDFDDKDIREHKYAPLYGAGASYDMQNIRLNGGWRRIQHNDSFHNIDFGYVGAAVYLG
jgi:hypothetical protein